MLHRETSKSVKQTMEFNNRKLRFVENARKKGDLHYKLRADLWENACYT